jgi:endonuclease/exonuclease/phosphatase family metal-dependent hydrolase
MPLGKPSSSLLLGIHEKSATPAKTQTLRFLADHGLAEPQEGKGGSRVPRDWSLTDRGRRAARDLLENGIAYLPGELAAERATLEASSRRIPAASLLASDPHDGKLPTELAVATWNLRSSSDPDRTLAYLASLSWDIACLQEVGVLASNRIRAQDGWSVVNGLELAWNEGAGSPKRPHGAALVARNGWRLDRGEAIADSPKPGRGVIALASRDEEAVPVMSWHAPNRAGQGLEAKMRGYRAMIEAVRRLDGPLIVGMDANHPSPGISLDPTDPHPDHEHELEIEFFSCEPGHRLSDALLAYFRANPRAYDKVLRERPEGPLAVTYTHGRTADRYDYIMVSPEFDVVDILHDYDGALEAGSDHGFVSAQLTVRTADC